MCALCPRTHTPGSQRVAGLQPPPVPPTPPTPPPCLDFPLCAGAAPTSGTYSLVPALPRLCHGVNAGGEEGGPQPGQVGGVPGPGSPVVSALTQAEVDCQSAIKPQVSLELFSVLLDAPRSIIALKAVIQVQEFVCHHPEAGRGSAMVAPLLSQSHRNPNAASLCSGRGGSAGGRGGHGPCRVPKEGSHPSTPRLPRRRTGIEMRCVKEKANQSSCTPPPQVRGGGREGEGESPSVFTIPKRQRSLLLAVLTTCDPFPSTF